MRASHKNSSEYFHDAIEESNEASPLKRSLIKRQSYKTAGEVMSTGSSGRESSRASTHEDVNQLPSVEVKPVSGKNLKIIFKKDEKVKRKLSLLLDELRAKTSRASPKVEEAISEFLELRNHFAVGLK
jgi:hypothetical protein